MLKRILALCSILLLGLIGSAEAAVNLSVGSLIGLLVWLIVIAIIFWLLWWLIGYIGLPEPFNKIARVAIAIVAVLVLINFLLSLAGSPMFTLNR